MMVRNEVPFVVSWKSNRSLSHHRQLCYDGLYSINIQRVFLAYVYHFFSVETHHACNLHQLNKVFEYPCLKLMFYFTFKLICIITRLYRLHMVQLISIIRQSDKYWYGITHGNHYGNNIHQTLNSQYIAHMFLFIICYALLIMCVLKTMTLW